MSLTDAASRSSYVSWKLLSKLEGNGQAVTWRLCVAHPPTPWTVGVPVTWAVCWWTLQFLVVRTFPFPFWVDPYISTSSILMAAQCPWFITHSALGHLAIIDEVEVDSSLCFFQYPLPSFLLWGKKIVLVGPPNPALWLDSLTGVKGFLKYHNRPTCIPWVVYWMFGFRGGPSVPSRRGFNLPSRTFSCSRAVLASW